MQSIHGLLSVSGLETLIQADGSTVIYPPQCHYAIARLDMHAYSREYSVELSVVGQQDVSRALYRARDVYRSSLYHGLHAAFLTTAGWAAPAVT